MDGHSIHTNEMAEINNESNSLINSRCDNTFEIIVNNSDIPTLNKNTENNINNNKIMNKNDEQYSVNKCDDNKNALSSSNMNLKTIHMTQKRKKLPQTNAPHVNTSNNNQSNSNNNCNSNNNNNNSNNFINKTTKRQRTDVDISKIPKTNEINNIMKPTLPSKPQLLTKPPIIPPKQNNCDNKIAATKISKKMDDNNAISIQKLTLVTQQLRQEISELNVLLNTERAAIRTLRALHDAESRKAKIENKKLQDALQVKQQMAVKRKIINSTHSTNLNDTNVVIANKKINNNNNNNKTNVISNCKDDSAANDEMGKINIQQCFLTDIAKLNQEILVLKESNKFLEEKFQISSEADRRKASDIRELKDSYELRLTQISKSAKIETHRLLDEIRSKDKSIGLMKKKLMTFKDTNKKDTKKTVQLTPNMRKDNEIERSNCISKTNFNTNNNNNTIVNNFDNNIKSNSNKTTCGIETNLMSPEMLHDERILVVGNDFCTNKDLSISDNDSAVSSAPPSLSPQPGTYPNTSDVWQSFVKESRELENLHKDYESLHEENQFLNHELSSAKHQIKELEETLFLMSDQNKTINEQYITEMNYLKNKENIFLKETEELREQNELLEFRIIELEESHDKYTKNKLTTEDMGPNSQRESNELIAIPENMDLDMECMQQTNENQPLSNDDLRKKIMVMSKRNYYDVEDKMCLLQILSLLNNLEALSQDHEISGGNHDCIGTSKYKSSADCTQSSTCSSTRPFSDSLRPSSQERIVATVQPYNNNNNYNETCSNICDTIDLPPPSNEKIPIPCNDSPLKRSRYLSTLSLQESGVFVDPPELVTKYTQTDKDFSFVEYNIEEGNGIAVNGGELSAEIQKLNKFRKKVEECNINKDIGNSNGLLSAPPPSSSSSSAAAHQTSIPNTYQKHFEFYKERIELLENKLLIYESSGDVQMRHLGKRLQREIQLESLLKQLTERIDKFKIENQKLEEEKCEFEEAENDTRLHLQKLEIELDILSQRNVELEMSRDRFKSHTNCLQDGMDTAQDRIYALEEQEIDLKNKLDLITAFMPTILLYNNWKIQQHSFNSNNNNNKNPSTTTKSAEYSDMEKSTQQQQQQLQNKQFNQMQLTNNTICDSERLMELMNRERELTEYINDLKQAYNETIERADNFWAQMEKEYKDKLLEAEELQNLLKCKINQIELRSKKDSQYAQERINQLEESENLLKHKLSKMHVDYKTIQTKYQTIHDELLMLTEEYAKLKAFLEGPIKENMRREKQKVKELQIEINLCNKMLIDLDEIHKKEITKLKNQLFQLNNELINNGVNNGELKEEVITLENRIMELNNQKEADEKMIKHLMNEINIKSINVPLTIADASSASTSSAMSLTTQSSFDVTNNLAEELANVGDNFNCYVINTNSNCPQTTVAAVAIDNKLIDAMDVNIENGCECKNKNKQSTIVNNQINATATNSFEDNNIESPKTKNRVSQLAARYV